MSVNSEFHTILFADNTTLYDYDTEWPALFHKFNNKFRDIYKWITINQMALNESKTKIMFLTKKHNTFPNSRYKQTVLFYPHGLKKAGFLYKQIEVVSEFKLLGIMLDESLSFNSNVKQLKSNVNTKLFSIQRTFLCLLVSKFNFLKHFYYLILIIAILYVFILQTQS